MPAYARRDLIRDGEVTLVHCTNRCVRRSFLCGYDRKTGNDYEHRKQWIEKRIEFLASVFGIESITFAVMSNHLHLILRTRPDLVELWSDEEVARRWWKLFPKRRRDDGSAAKPGKNDLVYLLSDPEVLMERRRRLANISWFMRCLSENIARRANKEDGVTGRFWEGRFKSQVLLDEAALLACSVYVDLNPVRALIAKSPANSRYTSAYRRIADRTAGYVDERGRIKPGYAAIARSGWLAPIQSIARSTTDHVRRRTKTRRRNRKHDQTRVSDDGSFALSLDEYVAILEWTSNQIQREKRDVDAIEVAPILNRIGIRNDKWTDCVENFGHWFHRAAGTAASLAAEAKTTGKGWLHGVRKCREVFG